MCRESNSRSVHHLTILSWVCVAVLGACSSSPGHPDGGGGGGGSGHGGASGSTAGSDGGAGTGGSAGGGAGAGGSIAGSDGGAGHDAAGGSTAGVDGSAGHDGSADVSDGGGSDTEAGPVAEHFVILHSNDLHSYLQGHSPETDYTPVTPNDDATIGGFSRLATIVGTAKASAQAAGKSVLLLDAGDFMMGTLFSWLGTSQAAELKLMDALGYDATTIGNHELDWTPNGLAAILLAATNANVKVPLVASNMKFDATSTADDALEAFKDPGPIKTKLVKTVGHLKVGIFGLLGKDAAAVTPTAKPLTFEDIATAAARVTMDLRQNDKVDVVIALSHSGIGANGMGEDQVLATMVPDIDVIVSGHTHEILAAPAKVGKTLIVTAGAYGEHLGQLELSATPGTPGVTLEKYTLLDVDDKTTGDVTTQAGIDAYIGGLDTALAAGGFGYKKVIAETSFDLTRASGESTIGDVVTDAYRAVTASLQPTAPPAIAVEANGNIRTLVAKGKTGKIWFADLFRVVPLGIGLDGKPGFPLVTYYLNGKDLRAGFELGAAAGVVSNDYFLQTSGLKVTYDMTKPVFQRVAALALVPGAGAPQTIDPTSTTQCYKVVSTYFVASLLGTVSAATGGALSVTAKESDCATAVTDLSTHLVDASPATAGTQELKQWQAVTSFFGGLPDTDTNAIPNVPAVYGALQGRIVTQ
jgi:5'-nucleotidase